MPTLDILAECSASLSITPKNVSRKWNGVAYFGDDSSVCECVELLLHGPVAWSAVVRPGIGARVSEK